MVRDIRWEKGFAERLRKFSQSHAPSAGEFPVSIKIRITSGCFHREHSPQAYKIIDEGLRDLPKDVAWEEHESGPEIIAWAAAGVCLGYQRNQSG